MHKHQSTHITLYIYIKVLLIFSGYIGRYAGVAACVRHLSVSDLDNSPVGCDRHMLIAAQDLKKQFFLSIYLTSKDLLVLSE